MGKVRGEVRAVTHLNVSRDDTDAAIAAARSNQQLPGIQLGLIDLAHRAHGQVRPDTVQVGGAATIEAGFGDLLGRTTLELIH
jgi:hypothetical protein